MAADFAAGFDFAPRGHSPVEEGVEAGDTDACLGGLYVFEKSGEPPDDLARVEVFGNVTKGFQIDVGFGGSGGPEAEADFVDGELAFESEKHIPFEVGEVNDSDLNHLGERLDSVARFDILAPNMAYSQGKYPFGGHEFIVGGASFFHQDFAVGIHRLADWHLEGGPKAVVASGGLGIGRADDDMTTEGIVLEHEVEGVGEFVFTDFPGDESAFGEVAGDEGLTHAANGARCEH